MDKEKKEKKKREENNLNLPISGFAEDVLGSLKESENTPIEEEKMKGPERLYAFADSLEKEKENDSEQTTDVETKLETWVSFMLEKEYFALPVTNVQEILRVTSITRVPHAPYPVRGVTNIRGRVLPVVDLRLRLGLKQKEIDTNSRILVVLSKGRLMGLLVDNVHQVFRINVKDIQPPPPEVMTEHSDYIIGIYNFENKIFILLDVDKTLIIKENL